MSFLQDVGDFFGMGKPIGATQAHIWPMGAPPDGVPEDANMYSSGRLPPHSDGSPFTIEEKTSMLEYWKTQNEAIDAGNKEDKQDRENNSFMGITNSIVTKVAIIGAGAYIVTKML